MARGDGPGAHARLLARTALKIADGDGGAGTWLLACALAHPSLRDDDLRGACGEYAEAVRVRDDIHADPDLWAHYYPGLEQGPDQAAAARSLADGDAADALRVLAAGRTR